MIILFLIKLRDTLLSDSLVIFELQSICASGALFYDKKKNLTNVYFFCINTKNLLKLCKHSHPGIYAPQKITLLINTDLLWLYLLSVERKPPLNNNFSQVQVILCTSI